MEVLTAKICSILVLGIGSMLMGLLPAWLSHRGFSLRPLLVSSLLCLGGGVLLATSLIHMLPEFKHHFKDYESYAELIYCTGFFFVFLVDELIHFFIGDTHHDHSHDLTLQVKDNISTAPTSIMLNDKQGCSNTIKPDPRYGTIEVDPLLHNGRQQPYNPTYGNGNNAWDETPSQLCHVTHKEPCKVSPVSTLSLLIALTIHEFVEGLPIGLQTSTSKVFLLLGAISSHKLIVAFCLGVELSSTTASSFFRHLIFIFTFTIGSVLGIAVGMAISKVPANVSDVLFPVLQGITGGTLLYVTVSEILPRERARWHKENSQKTAGLVQFVSVAAGFAIMAALTIYFDKHDHGH